MKKHIYILLAILLLTACKKESGTVLYKINFTTNKIAIENNNSAKGTKAAPENLYTEFGDYITSLTPQKFTAHIWTIGYIDTVLDRNSNNSNMLQYIEQNGEKLSAEDPTRYIDFSDNNVVSFDPVIYGQLRDGIFEEPKIDFIYFYFIPFCFYQEVLLPAQYQNIWIKMFNVTITENNLLNVGYNEMLNKIFPEATVNNYVCFIFGNTDSTYVVNANSETVGFSEDCPIADPGQNLVIRSNKYSNMTFYSPLDGGTIIMNGILSFNTEDLIQVYAGEDNIPYTSDDIFVYAPNFWERINSRLDIE